MLKFTIGLAAFGLCAAPVVAQDRSGADSVAARAGLNGQELRLIAGGLSSGEPGLHTNRIFAFGRPRAQIVAAVTAIRGRPTSSNTNRHCRAGPMAFVHFGGLTLNFRRGRFVGWGVNEPAGRQPIRDEWGLGLGTSRANLTDGDQEPATIETTSRGVEFNAGGIGGLLSSNAPDATVTNLWAGTTCRRR